MKFAIVGANGQVGTELCFLLRNEGFEVVPIVRNKLAAGFLDYHGFACRIADISDEKDAREALNDIDVIVVAALASGLQARRINRLLVRNAVKFSKASARIIYFSSIRAFSSAIDENTPRFWFSPPYDKEKRCLEKFLLRLSKREAKKGYALRLGHVLGISTSRTQQFKDLVSNKGIVYLRVSPNKPSNTLHTVTLKEAIILCAKGNVRPGIYTVVNNPQWTWKEVFEYYAKDTSLVFLEEGMEHKSRFLKLKNICQTLLQTFWSVAISREKFLYPLTWYLPKKAKIIIRRRYLLSKIKSEISALEGNDRPIWRHEFAYRPAPGPFLPGLSDTKSLLKDMDSLANIFALNRGNCNGQIETSGAS